MRSGIVPGVSIPTPPCVVAARPWHRRFAHRLRHGTEYRRPTTGGAILLAMFAIGAVLGAVAAVGSLFALVWP